jgi:hypothetical protein
VVERALELAATAVVLMRNHPSGDPTPSRVDVQMTQAIVEVATRKRTAPFLPPLLFPSLRPRRAPSSLRCLDPASPDG